MPWAPDDATSHTKLANTPKRKRMWAQVANNILRETDDDVRAIRGANNAVAEDHENSKSTFYRNLRIILNESLQ